MFADNTPIEDIPKKEKEFYAEYVFNQFEMPDENVSTTVDYTNATTVETTMANGVYKTILSNVDSISKIVRYNENGNVAVVFDQDSLKVVLAKLNQNDTMYGPEIGFENNRISPSNITGNTSATVGGNGTASTTDNIDDYLSDRKLFEARDFKDDNLLINIQQVGLDYHFVLFYKEKARKKIYLFVARGNTLISYTKDIQIFLDDV